MHYTLAELQAMPTINQGHFANLKVETATTRVWLSRCTKEDGERCNNKVTVDKFTGGRWHTVAEYEAL